MPAHSKSERRALMAERAPACPSPAQVPPLAGLECPAPQLAAECDILILGTGLHELVLAAALAWLGAAVMHVDANGYYGDHLCTMTLDQVKKWCVEVNAGRVRHHSDAQMYIPGGKRTNAHKLRDYGIDLSPKVLFAQLDLLALLVKSRVHRYLEFQGVSNFHVFENDNFKNKVTTTLKQDIFLDQLMLLQTKRQLMRFLKFVLTDDPARAQTLKDSASVPIEQFLAEKFHLGAPQLDELVYLIGLAPRAGTPTPEAVARIRRFLVLYDVYGSFPVLVSKYGGPGELAQGFCRSAAVAGATYKLDCRLADYDPQLRVATFADGSRVRVNEKLVVAPTQVPRFLQLSYRQLANQLPEYTVTRLISVVRRDCREWMGDNEHLAVVVFPPRSLPTGNEHAVQVLIQNGGTGVCPAGELVWFSHLCEPLPARAKEDLAAAFAKMEAALLRELANLDSVLDPGDFAVLRLGTPILVNLFKLGELGGFAPQLLDVVCKVGFVQTTLVNPNLSNVLAPSSDNIATMSPSDALDIIFTNMPSGEASYDGVVGDVKTVYLRITGTDEDFFDVDFEDEPRAEFEGRDVDDEAHEPFGAGDLEL